MKFTIEGFQQSVLLELGLNANDAIILRWMDDFLKSKRMKILRREEKEYFWIHYKTVLKELPILRIKNTEVLGRWFKKYIHCGLMELYIHQNRYTYYAFNPTIYNKLSDSTRHRLDTLNISDVSLTEITPTNESRLPPLESRPIDSSLKDSSITNTNGTNGTSEHLLRKFSDLASDSYHLVNGKNIENPMNIDLIGHYKNIHNLTDEIIINALQTFNWLLDHNRYNNIEHPVAYFMHALKVGKVEILKDFIEWRSIIMNEIQFHNKDD